MCLVISVDNEKQLEKIRKKGKSLLGYKVLDLPENGKIYRSPYYRYKEWRKNKTGVYISDRKGVSLDFHEKEQGRVYHGFHFYRTRQEARDNKVYLEVIVQFEIDPKDIVAFGSGNDFVATKCKMIKRVR